MPPGRLLHALRLLGAVLCTAGVPAQAAAVPATGSGGPAAAASDAASGPAGGRTDEQAGIQAAEARFAERRRRCEAHPVRAVRTECLAQARRDHEAALKALAARSGG